MNTYLYAFANPIKHTDPFGLLPPGWAEQNLPRSNVKECTYYEMQCSATGCRYYCVTGGLVCRTAEFNPLFASISTEKLNCIRSCLIEEDQKAQDSQDEGCGDPPCLDNQTIDDYHDKCFATCGVPPSRYPGTEPFGFNFGNP